MADEFVTFLSTEMKKAPHSGAPESVEKVLRLFRQGTIPWLGEAKPYVFCHMAKDTLRA